MKFKLRNFFSYYIVVIFASLIPLMLFGIFTYKNEKELRNKETHRNLSAINKDLSEDINGYFHKINFQLNELKNNIHFFQEQASHNIENIQDLQLKHIKSYYVSIEQLIKQSALVNSTKLYQNGYFEGVSDILESDENGTIIYERNGTTLLHQSVSTLTATLPAVLKDLAKGKHKVLIADLAYENITKSYKQYMVTHKKDHDGFILFAIDQEPIDAILHDVYSLGDTAESYLIYKHDDTTALASNRVVKNGYVGDKKWSKQIQKGFTQSGVEIKYGSTGNIELVGFRPFRYKNIVRTLQTTVRYIDIISPKINKISYFEAFLYDYHFANIFLVSSKAQVIHSVYHKIMFTTQLQELFHDVMQTKKYQIRYIDGSLYAGVALLNNQNNVEIVLISQISMTGLKNILKKDVANYYKTLFNQIITSQKEVIASSFMTAREESFDENLLYVVSPLDIMGGTFKWLAFSAIDKKEIDEMTVAIKKEIVIFMVLFSLLAVMIIVLVSHYKKLQDKRLLYSATHDPLTQLPNRAYIYTYLEKVLEDTNDEGAILFMDLDNFKFINDSFGHEAGDIVLKEVSKRLKRVIRQDDLLARLGGDEFVIIVKRFYSYEQIEQICERIISTVCIPIEAQGSIYQVGVSIGISIFPKDSDNVQQLLQFADTAMYKTKAKGRNGYTFYATEMTLNSLHATRVKNELREAIEKGQLRLYYQPQIDLFSKKVVGVEALVRWAHPVDGLIMPNNFIPMAEENNLIVELGKWVTRKACEDFASWKHLGYDLEYVAVNMSAKQLLSHDFAQFVSTLFKQLHFTPSWLELEITENTLVQNIDRVQKNIAYFQSIGINFSIDDFGTGYSSLTYLKSLPISTLKIDREFIKDILVDDDDLSIVQAVINMGHSMAYRIIAEGAEDMKSVALLQELGCDVVQGYVYAKPLKEFELLEFLESMQKNYKDKKDVK